MSELCEQMITISSTLDLGPWTLDLGPLFKNFSPLSDCVSSNRARILRRGEMMKIIRSIVCSGVIVITSGAVFGQAPAPAPAFEVASIKPSDPITDGKMRVYMGRDPGRVNYKNVSLKDVLQRAYNVRRVQISGPEWLDSDRYDIVGKVPAGVSDDQIPAMLQSLLSERFKLTLHREKKETPVYALLVGKNGPKLEKAEDGESTPGKHQGITVRSGATPGIANMEAYRATVTQFANMLSNLLDRPVIDQTEIQGIYNFTLDVSTEEISAGKRVGGGPGPEGVGTPRGDGGPAPDGAPGPSIFSAIQKLGLKLEPRKAPLDFIIIDKGERIPTEN